MLDRVLLRHDMRVTAAAGSSAVATAYLDGVGPLRGQRAGHWRGWIVNGFEGRAPMPPDARIGDVEPGCLRARHCRIAVRIGRDADAQQLPVGAVEIEGVDRAADIRRCTVDARQPGVQRET